jgi:hypothetical protein
MILGQGTYMDRKKYIDIFSAQLSYEKYSNART